MDWLLRYSDPSIDWTYAMVTLVVRFIGVFIVMFVMQLALQASSRLLRVYERRGQVAPAPAADAAPVAAHPPSAAVIEDAELAAIALALSLEARPAPAPFPQGEGPSPWAVAGRLQQLQRAPR
jgi:hypothetical protein